MPKSFSWPGGYNCDVHSWLRSRGRLALAVGCAVQAFIGGCLCAKVPEGVVFACAEQIDCPDGTRCREGHCLPVTSGMVLDGGDDAGAPDGGNPNPNAVALVFLGQPQGVDAGEPLPDFAVAAHDSLGRVASSFRAPVDVTLADGGTLLGVTKRSADGGIVTFSGLVVQEPRLDARLVVSSSGLSATSDPFDVMGTPFLDFDPQPGDLETDDVFVASVKLVDDHGSVRADTGLAVTLSLSGPGGIEEPLGSQALAAGWARFVGLSVSDAGVYHLQAVADGVDAGQSRQFTVWSRPASLRFTSSSALNSDAGEPLPLPVEVEVLDKVGSRVRDVSARIALFLLLDGGSFDPDAGPTRLSLDDGGQAIAEIESDGGLATFEGLAAELPGTYQLEAEAVGLGLRDRGPLWFVHGVWLRFLVSPTGIVDGETMPVVVQAMREDGDASVEWSNPIWLVLDPNPTDAGMQSESPQTPWQGYGLFSVNIDRSGSGYGLRATSRLAAPAVSGTFDVDCAVKTDAGVCCNDPKGFEMGGGACCIGGLLDSGSCCSKWDSVKGLCCLGVPMDSGCCQGLVMDSGMCCSSGLIDDAGFCCPAGLTDAGRCRGSGGCSSVTEPGDASALWCVVLLVLALGHTVRRPATRGALRPRP